jgi:hypothetical protein
MKRSPTSATTAQTWLLLIHAIPPKPAYLRIKVGRRLQGLGAVAIKNSVYALPAGDEAREDFQWVAREIAAAGGEASVVEGAFVEGLDDAQVEGLFQQAREADYAAVVEEARRLRAAAGKGRTIAGELGRLRRWLADVVAIDHFGANGREAAEALVAELEATMQPSSKTATRSKPDAVGTGRTWVTRKGIKVDRIASAWLIRRFIDPAARFKFVAGQHYRPAKGELRFDMFEAEYTHAGDRCTFEVLLERFALTDPALAQLGELVHDVDLKDGKFGRPEAAGLDRMLAGLAASTADDEARLAQGSQLFASLYESFRGKPA